MTSRSRAPCIALLALLGTPALSAAQPAQTGTAPLHGVDPSYTVSWVRNPAPFGSAFGPAYSLGRTTDGVRWIAPDPSGSLSGGGADGFLDRFRYAFRTSFGAADLASISFQCAFDDLFDSILLNGSAVAGATCGQYGFGAVQLLSGFAPGVNTLEFRTMGNGVTDGFAFRVTAVTRHEPTAVPEPATWALLGGGLLLLGAIGVRRQRG